jgi:hypothetical protein
LFVVIAYSPHAHQTDRLCNEDSNQTTHGTAHRFLLSALGSVAWMFGMHAALHTNFRSRSH